MPRVKLVGKDKEAERTNKQTNKNKNTGRKMGKTQISSRKSNAPRVKLL